MSKLISSVVNYEANVIESASNNFSFSAAISGFALLIRESKFKGNINFDLIEELADKSLGDNKYGYRDEFLSIAKRTKRLSQGLSRIN